MITINKHIYKWLCYLGGAGVFLTAAMLGYDLATQKAGFHSLVEIVFYLFFLAVMIYSGKGKKKLTCKVCKTRIDSAFCPVCGTKVFEEQNDSIDYNVDFASSEDSMYDDGKEYIETKEDYDKVQNAIVGRILANNEDSFF